MTRTTSVDIAILGCGIVGSFAAGRQLDAGVSVAVIETGNPPGTPPAPPDPMITARDRAHAGIVDARHHEPGGNSAYWGGAMLRVPEDDMADVVASPLFAASPMAAAYAEVERALGFPAVPSREHWDGVAGNRTIRLTRAMVLPPRTKNVFASRLASRLPSIHARFASRVQSIDVSGGRLRAIRIAGRSGEEEVIEAERFLLSMGMVDSNLFAQRFSRELFGEPPASLSKRLHDHLSVPLFRVAARAEGDFLSRFAPRFDNGFLVVPRFEFLAPGPPGAWTPRAFLHFVFDFESVPLYSNLKALLALRQSGGSPSAFAGKALKVALGGGELLKVAATRLLSKRLRITREVPVIAMLDFETFPHEENRIAWHGSAATRQADLFWNVRMEDVAAYRALLPHAEALVDQLSCDHGFDATPMWNTADADGAVRHLHETGKDILHLGGGLAPHTDALLAVTGPELAFPEAQNLYAVSAASLTRASVVNPTHTLLAMATRVLSRHP